MYKAKSPRCTITLVPKESNLIDSATVRPIDTFESANYMLNSFGHIRNDFATLSDSQDELQFQRTLSRMQELHSEPTAKDASFDELVSTLRPRWCQTPAELDRFEQYVIDNELDFYKSVQSKQSESMATADIDLEASSSVSAKAE